MNLAYIAGFVDGEGCIGFGRARTSIFPRVLITNTDREILEDIRDQFGGDIKPLAARRDRWKQGWYLRLSWSRAVNFLDAINPYLRLKAEQARTIFAWDAIRLGSGSVSKIRRVQYDDACSLLIERIKWLNSKGPRLMDDPINRVIALSVAGKARKRKK